MTSSPPTSGPTAEAQLARRRRINLAIMIAVVAAVIGWHAVDAFRRGQSLWPVALALPVMGLALYLPLRFMARPIAGLSPTEARQARARQLIRWTAPLAVGFLALAATLRGCFGG